MSKIKYKYGNLIHADEYLIAHGCNSKGVQGSGVALAIRNRYPESYEFYKHEFNVSGLELGNTYTWIGDDRAVIHCITQKNYGRRVEAVSFRLPYAF
jgi:O-acetyl-ADP-ribose deacetylase (regulator of RNase III)